MHAGLQSFVVDERSGWDDPVTEAVMTRDSGEELGEASLAQLRERAAALHEKLKPRLRRMVELRIAQRLQGRIDVDDVLHDALLRLLDSLGSHRPRSVAQLRAWIFKKTWSRWQDELRKWKTAGRDVAHEEPFPDGSVVALVHGIGVATNYGLKETVERIREVLNPIDFQIVELRIVDELSYEEIAEFLDKTPGAIGRRYIRALVKIREVVASPFTSSS